MIIGGFAPTTLLDYPGKLACTIFTNGCNFRCPFCQNGSLVLPALNSDSYTEDEILSKLKKRQGVLEGVCISGGEPTIQKDLPNFLKKIKEMDYYIKLDTNGTNPSMLQYFIEHKLIDSVAMDVKAGPDSYAAICGLSQQDLTPIRESIQLLITGSIEYEFRTTLVKGLHTRKDILDLREWLNGAKAYYLQSYEESDRILSLLQGQSLSFSSFSKEELTNFLHLIQETIPTASIRGVDF